MPRTGGNSRVLPRHAHAHVLAWSEQSALAATRTPVLCARVHLTYLPLHKDRQEHLCRFFGAPACRVFTDQLGRFRMRPVNFPPPHCLPHDHSSAASGASLRPAESGVLGGRVGAFPRVRPSPAITPPIRPYQPTRSVRARPKLTITCALLGSTRPRTHGDWLESCYSWCLVPGQPSLARRQG